MWPAATDPVVAPASCEHLRRCQRCAARVDELRRLRLELPQAASPTDENLALEFARDVFPGPFCGDTPASQPGSALPTQIGRYAILRLLKIGGQAEVYLARHPTTGENVVVKWTHVELARRPSAARRIADEVRFLAALRHPIVVRVLDLGIAASRPFLVMEHIAGRPLAGDNAPALPPRQAARLIAAVARGLQCVHDAGRLHLDLQPDNILIDEHGRTRLIDFGLSLPLDAGRLDLASDCTQGTLEYMAPEQLAGDVSGLSAATDVYALGAVLFHLLTGAPPQPELLWSSWTTAQWLPEQPVPGPLQRICRRALAPEPAQRFATAAELAEALERFADRRVWPRFATVAGAVLATILVSGALVRNWLAPPSQASPAIELPSTALASAIRQALDHTAGAPRTAWLVFADGRRLPVHLDRRDAGTGPSALDFVDPLSSELSCMTAPCMLVVICRRPELTGTGDAGFDWPELRRPALPAGALAELTERDIVLVADARGVPLPPAVDQAIRAQLQRLQRELRATSTRFCAVVIGGAACEGATHAGCRSPR
ncbi:MAG: serine/threonine-protein kinase [Planctomycetaceae bacterium]